jgi:HlyD family secretion protein
MESNMDIPKPAATRTRARRKRIVAALLAVAATTGLAVTMIALGDPQPTLDREGLWIGTAIRGDMTHEIRATGVLIPKRIHWVTAEVDATVQEVLVLPGARVQSDTVIVRLNNPAARASLERARAAHVGAEAEAAVQASALELALAEQDAALARTRSEYRLSRARAEAQARAEAAGAVSKMELRQSEIEMEKQGASVAVEERRLTEMRRNHALQLQAIRADRNQSASALAVAEREWESLQVRAGIAGVLQQLDAEPGRRVAVGASLARVADQRALIARLYVPELQAKDLELGLAVQVDLRSARVAGRIERIDPAVKEGRVAIDVALPGALPAEARPDLSVDGRIVVNRLKDTLSIPRPPSATAHGSGELFVLREPNTAERVRVVYGAASEDRIQVLSGLRQGERVVLSDVGSAARHARVVLE